MKTSSICLALLLLLASVVAWAQETPQPDTDTTTTTTDTEPAPPARASLNPDISVVGNITGMLANEGLDEDTHLQLDEIELVVGSKLYPGVRGDLVIAGGADESAGVEEGYLTAERLTRVAPIGARVGIIRLPFGKTNPLHPHSLPSIDSPSVVENLLGEFRGNGFEVVALLPTHSNLFLQAQLGRWTNLGEPSEGAGFGGDKAFTLGRIWAGMPLPHDAELEIGASGAQGKGVFDEGTSTRAGDITLFGADVTWRKWLPGERRLLVQGEYISRKQDFRSNGYFLLGAYRPSHYYEFGARYDWSEFADDNSVHASAVSLFATKFLSETTYLRLQAKHGADRDGQNFTELSMQIVFGFGPHAHALQ
ncbi:MAG: hypothetical protein ACYC7E_17110 [Armatimonadota bacterium]